MKLQNHLMILASRYFTSKNIPTTAATETPHIRRDLKNESTNAGSKELVEDRNENNATIQGTENTRMIIDTSIKNELLNIPLKLIYVDALSFYGNKSS